MAAAVGDFRVGQTMPHKIKKKSTGLTIKLIPTPDILADVASARVQRAYPRIVVGFAAETENVLENARAKLASKRLDLVVANDVTAPGAGFAVDTNVVTLVDAEGRADELPRMSKPAVAEVVLDWVVRAIPPISSCHGE
jgi:phosphopantothenoylcysteine decarboxylase/phosphopantothenate--cysteine ligase